MTGIFSLFRPSAGTDMTTWILSDILRLDAGSVRHLKKTELDSLLQSCSQQHKKLVKIQMGLQLNAQNAGYISCLVADIRKVNEIRELATARLRQI